MSFKGFNIPETEAEVFNREFERRLDVIAKDDGLTDLQKNQLTFALWDIYQTTKVEKDDVWSFTGAVSWADRMKLIDLIWNDYVIGVLKRKDFIP